MNLTAHLHFVSSFRMNIPAKCFHDRTGSLPVYFYHAESICLNKSFMTIKIDFAQFTFFKIIKFCLNKFLLRETYNVTLRRLCASIVAVEKQ